MDAQLAQGEGPSVLAPDDERSLVAQLTRDVLADAAPEETGVFAKDESGWVDGTHRTAAPRDDMTGFGAEAIAIVLTPYVVAAARTAIRYVAGIVAETAGAEIRPKVAAWVRGLFGQEAVEAVPPTLPVGVVRRVREETLRTLRDMGLPEDDAALVSDTVAGRLVLAGA